MQKFYFSKKKIIGWVVLCLAMGTVAQAQTVTYTANSTNTPFLNFPQTLQSDDVCIGDFDGDGRDDVLYQTNGDGSPYGYAKSIGGGSFTWMPISASPFAGVEAQLPANLGNGSEVHIADFDSDGDMDVWFALQNQPGIYLQNNGGTFSLGNAAVFPVPDFLNRIGVADFDNDGFPDIFCEKSLGVFGYYKNNRTKGTAFFIEIPIAASPFGGLSISGLSTGFFLADYDNDGDIDIWMPAINAPGSLLVNYGNVFVAENATGFPSLTDTRNAVVADFDSDGLPDVLYQTSVGFPNYHFAKNLGGFYLQVSPLVLSPFATIAGPNQFPDYNNFQLGDFDGDTDIDLWYPRNNTYGYYYSQNGAPPRIINTVPANNATNVSALSNIEITLSEPVVKSTGKITIMNIATLAVQEIDMLDVSVLPGGMTCAIRLPSPLPTGSYAVQILPGTFKDLSNVSFMGISDITSFTFTAIGANTPPVALRDTVIVTGPPQNGNVLTNDSDAEGDALTASLVTAPVNGTVVLNADGSFTYTMNTPDANSPQTDSLIYQVCDNGRPSTCDTSTLTLMLMVNNPPSVTAPASIVVTEDTASAVTGISFFDQDAGTDPVTVTLTVPEGTLTATATPQVTVSGSGTGALTLTGAIDEINSFITDSSVLYLPLPNATNTVPLAIMINDNGHTGGPAETASDSSNLVITAVNDAPTITAPASISAIEDASVTISGISFSDVDAGNNPVTVTFSAATGTLTATATPQVTITGSGTNTITLTGAITDLNSFITANSVRYLPVPNANGTVVLNTLINDNGHTGGPAATATTSTNLLFAAINDSPTVTAPPTIAVVEDGPQPFKIYLLMM
ncbi:FG-GAP-like repeat-containing protein [Chitinophaga sp. MM2321]|uniref:FG-GAP-like repeat-containing protein n=1 Tax=Chitinophaga sp. MM2321 TaxID=3137178 RepID=UPI0032D59756